MIPRRLAYVSMAAVSAFLACSGAGGGRGTGGTVGHAGGVADAGEESPPLDAAGDAPFDAPAEGGGADAGAATSVAVHATSGWQIYPGGGYHYGPSILVDTDHGIHMWTCSPGSGQNGNWDFVRYRHSADGGHSWTPDVIALQPTAGSADADSTCDPGAVKIGAYFYLGYTSTTNAKGTQNNVFVARSTSPTGPFAKWNGSGWGGAPQPIRTYGGDPNFYGYGEPSLVLVGKKLFVYYSDDQAAQYTDLATVDDATADDWPAHLVDHGHALARTRSAEDSADVKYVDARGLFVAVTTVDRFSPNASVAVYKSADGLVFEPAPYLGARAQLGAHNVGISGDLTGHLDPAAPSFVAYAYQPAGNGWGDWPTFLDPIVLGEAPWGTPVGGEVSSIVGGNDWSWSGPRAWDGDPSTVYSSVSHGTTSAAEEWAYVDVGAARSLTGITLVPRAGGYGFPIDFTIQTSADAVTWTTVPGQAHLAFANPGSAPVALPFAAPVTGRYLRVDATRLGTDNLGTCYLQLGEITPSIAP